MTLAAGTRLGPYEILSPLGAGGMGEVYRARDERLKREVAIKVLPSSVAGDPDALARFEREALAVAALSHPNILAIFDFGTQDGTAYAVTELLEGETLSAKLASGPIPAKQAIDYALQVAKGLAAAHERGVVHRDLKPDNLFVGRDGHVKILDFGLAKRHEKVAPGEETSAPTASGHTEPGTVMGTVGYMSPEQVRGLPLDHRTDIFSFGAILYEMLSGQKAFKKDNAVDTMSAITRDDPPDLSTSGRNISPALDHVVKHCLEKDRASRFQTAKDVAFALSEASSQGVGAMPVAPVSMRPWKLALAAAVAVIVVGTGLLVWSRAKAPVSGPAGGVKRVAVLPFENLGSPEDDYFVDGMSDEVRSKLTSLPGIEVIARASSNAYKKTTKRPRDIANELDVGYLLTATVRWQKADGTSRVHVTPELVEVRQTGAPASKWEQPFDAALTDVFRVQADIAAQVAQALGTVLTATDAKELAKRPTTNLAAYDAYLKGCEADDNVYLKEAREAFEKALALDPTFAMAMLRLAAFSDHEEAEALIRRAASERDRLTEQEKYQVDLSLAQVEGKPDLALKIAGELHQKYPADEVAVGVLAGAAEAGGDFSRAIKLRQDLLTVDPKNAFAYNFIGYYFVYSGNYEEGIKYLSKYQSLKPDSANPYDSLGEVQAYSGHYSEAIENLNRALAIKPDFWPAYWHLGVAAEGVGDYERAIQNYKKAADLAPNDDAKGDALTMGIWAAMNGGRTGDARSLDRALGEIPRSPTDSFTSIMTDLVAAENDYLDERYADAERRLRAVQPKIETWFQQEKNAGRQSGSKAHFPRVNWMLAMTLEKQGRVDEALPFWEANANPTDRIADLEIRRSVIEARARIAAIVARKGDFDRAEKLIAENHKWNANWAPARPFEMEVERLKREKAGH